MEDKQMIIDGVDVSKCYRYQKKTGYCEGAFKPEELPFCENFDCEFKQLARKTQECERSLKRISDLEERIINHSNEIEEYCSRLADKNKECEELKEYIQANKATGICETCTHIALIENDRYRKALEEINGLIQSTLDDFEEDSIDQQLEFSKQIGMNILDIINKAKDGE